MALFNDVNNPGFRATQMIDALAVLFFLVTIVLFVISMKFDVSTSIYSRLDSKE